MDNRRSFLNIFSAVVSRILLLVAALFVRRLLIQFIGNDVNGLNALFTDIIGTLGIAELGIGDAIIFLMYKPIVEGRTEQTAALYHLYRKLYLIVGAVIFAGGLLVIPFLPSLISDYNTLNENVYLSFVLLLISVVLTYVYGAKTSLIKAYKDNYITTWILTASRLVRFALQAVAILLWRSFPLFLSCQIVETLLVWILTDRIVRRKHNDILSLHEIADARTKAEVGKNVRAMFMHRIGTVLVNSVDSVIISAFIGVVVLGKYSNYILIVGVVSGTVALFFTPLTSVIGHLCVGREGEEIKEYYDAFYSLNYILGVVFFLGYYAIVDYIIRLCFGSGLEMSGPIVFIVTLNQFTKYMRNTQLLFRNASGTFYYDRWKPIAEGIANLVLSLLFVQIFPEEYRIAGVIAATIVTTLLICDIVDPYVVFKHVFGRKPWRFCVKNYAYIGLFVLAIFALSFLTRPFDSPLTGILVNGFISVGVSAAVLGLVFVVDKGFRHNVKTMGKKMRELVGGKRQEGN